MPTHPTRSMARRLAEAQHSLAAVRADDRLARRLRQVGYDGARIEEGEALIAGVQHAMEEAEATRRAAVTLRAEGTQLIANLGAVGAKLEAALHVPQCVVPARALGSGDAGERDVTLGVGAENAAEQRDRIARVAPFQRGLREKAVAEEVAWRLEEKAPRPVDRLVRAAAVDQRSDLGCYVAGTLLTHAQPSEGVGTVGESDCALPAGGCQ